MALYVVKFKILVGMENENYKIEVDLRYGSGWDKLTEDSQYNAKKLNELKNPPLKFEELHEGMRVWCKDLYDGCWLRILQTKTDNCGEPLIEAQLTENCFNPLMVLSYKEDRFYKKKLKTQWNDENS